MHSISEGCTVPKHAVPNRYGASRRALSLRKLKSLSSLLSQFFQEISYTA